MRIPPSRALVAAQGSANHRKCRAKSASWGLGFSVAGWGIPRATIFSTRSGAWVATP